MDKLARYLIPNFNEITREVHDLDLVDVVKKVNFCSSILGEQFLCYKIYESVRNKNPKNESDNIKFESLDRQKIESYKNALKSLNNYHNEDLVEIVFGDTTMPSHWSFKFSPYLLMLLLISFFLFIYNPSVSIIGITVLLTINTFIHIVSKGVIFYSKPYVLNMLDFSVVADKLSKINNNLKFESKNINNPFLFKILTLEERMERFTAIGEVTNTLLEILKAIFLIDPLIIAYIKSNIEVDKERLKKDFLLIGELDFHVSLFQFKNLYKKNICIPTFSQSDFSFQSLTHPLIDNCIPNSIEVKDNIVIITGSNLAGKSTMLKAIAVNMVLGKSLNYCFASNAIIPSEDIFTSFKIKDDLINAKSFFNVELDVVKKIILEAKQKSSIFLDEPFKGTNSDERMALNISLLRYLYKKNQRVFVTTHDVKLYNFLKGIADVYNFNLSINDDEIQFDYSLKHGAINNYYALKILEHKNFPESIIRESELTLDEIRDDK